MTWKLARVVASGMAFASFWALTAPVEGQDCNFQGEAEASVLASDGAVTSSHFGQITNVECAQHSRKMRMKVNTLVDNVQIWTDVLEGAKASLSASMFDSIGFRTCDGQWSSGTLFGTTFLGVLVGWLDSGVSGLTSGFCLPDVPDDINGCSAGGSETTTATLSAEGTSDVESDPGLGLSRTMERVEGPFLAEEWALISDDTGEFRVEFASSGDFVSHVEDRLDRYLPAGAGASTVLVVEAVAHPPNHRYMPTPGMAPFDVPLDGPSRADSQEFWFRAEVAETGGVDHLLLLDSSDPAANDAVRAGIEDRLELQYSDSRRHRVVVFGRAVVTLGGRLTLRDSLVLVPQCCCGSDEVHCV